jgi:argininosuccinate synthase
VSAVILYYDEYHTPLASLQAARSRFGELTVLHVRLGEDAPSPALSPDSGYRLILLDARDRFCDQVLCRAIKANAVYQGGYYLSAALSRPLLAEVCCEEMRRLRADVLIHGFAGNDSLRFAAGVMSLAPEPRICTVRSLCGSQTTANRDTYTISSNLWGSSIEAGDLGNPAASSLASSITRFTGDVEIGPRLETHTIAFESGQPVGLDGFRSPVRAIVEELNRIGRRYGVGRVDMVEDGHVGLKTRALYEAPAAAALITAHQDLERLVSTRNQNHVKHWIDAAWTDLVYEGYWFDPARESLEAYIDSVNRWVSGTVELAFVSGGVSVVSRSSPFAVYDESHAVYRAGQDFGEDLIDELARLQATAASIARARVASDMTRVLHERSGHPRGVHEPAPALRVRDKQSNSP